MALYDGLAEEHYTVEELVRDKEEGLITFLQEIYDLPRATAVALLKKVANSL